MPPSVKFNRQDIIQAAFHLVLKGGFKNMSASKVAEQLNASVQPIYSHFENIGALKHIVAEKSVTIFRDYVLKEYTPYSLFNMWIGEIHFALDHKRLYHTLFVERNNYEELTHAVNLETLNIFKAACICQNLSEDYVHSFYRHMQIYTYGLALIASNGFWSDSSREGITRVITEMGLVLLKADRKSVV